MMLGHEALLPPELVIGQAEPSGYRTMEYAAKLSEHIAQIHQFAHHHLKLSSESQKRITAL